MVIIYMNPSGQETISFAEETDRLITPPTLGLSIRTPEPTSPDNHLRFIRYYLDEGEKGTAEEVSISLDDPADADAADEAYWEVMGPMQSALEPPLKRGRSPTSSPVSPSTPEHSEEEDEPDRFEDMVDLHPADPWTVAHRPWFDARVYKMARPDPGREKAYEELVHHFRHDMEMTQALGRYKEAVDRQLDDSFQGYNGLDARIFLDCGRMFASRLFE